LVVGDYIGSSDSEDDKPPGEENIRLRNVYQRMYTRFVEIDDKLNSIPDANFEQRRRSIDLLQKIAGTLSRLEEQLGLAREESESLTDEQYKTLLQKLEDERKIDVETKKALMTFKSAFFGRKQDKRRLSY